MFQLINAAAVAVCLTVLCACAQSGIPPPAGSALPDIDGLDGRAASAVDETAMDGKDALLRSANAIELGTSLFLGSGPGSAEWAIYRLTPPVGMTAQSANVLLNDTATDEAWIALARYDTETWEHSGPHGMQQTLDLTVAGMQVLSPGGHVYVAVLCSGAHSAVIDSVSLTSEGNASPVASFTATPQTGAPGEPVTLDASGSSDVDGTIAKYEWDLNGDGSFELDNGLVPTAPTNLPSPAGEVEVGLRVTDDIGALAVTSLTLTSVAGNPIGPIAMGDVGNWQHKVTIAIVNGHPAIAYCTSGEDLKYVRAATADGSTWGPVQTLQNVQYAVGAARTLTIINGKPAFSYRQSDGGLYDLVYLSAADANGDTWNAPVTVLDRTDVDSQTMLAEVSGTPAIAYVPGNAGLRYIRALDPDGLTWGSKVSPDLDNTISNHFSLQVVNGNPALGYLVDRGSGAITAFVRAADPEGSSWNPPIEVMGAGGSGLIGAFMVNAGGNPAIARVEWGTGDVSYCRALDADGSAWDPPSVVTTLASADGNCFYFGMDGSRPALVYGWGGAEIAYIVANDSAGSSWGSPQLVDTALGSFAISPSLVQVAGAPGFAYRSGTSGQSDVWYRRL